MKKEEKLKKAYEILGLAEGASEKEIISVIARAKMNDENKNRKKARNLEKN